MNELGSLPSRNGIPGNFAWLTYVPRHLRVQACKVTDPSTFVDTHDGGRQHVNVGDWLVLIPGEPIPHILTQQEFSALFVAKGKK